MAVKKDYKTNKWYFVIELGKDPETGKRKQIRRRGFDGKKEAEAEYAKLLDEHNQGVLIEPSTMKYGEYMRQWLRWKKDDNEIGQQTADLYLSYIRNYIDKLLGQITLGGLEKHHIKNFKRELSKQISPKTAGKVLSVVRNSLDYAVDNDLIRKNVAKLVKAPKEEKKAKQKTSDNIKDDKLNVWDSNQINTFLKVAFNHKDYPVYKVALSCGCRIGEILGLSWSNVNLEQGTIRIVRELNKDGKVYPDDHEKDTFLLPKSDSGERTIELSKSTIKALKRQKALVSEMKLKAGEKYRENFEEYDLVICNHLGKPRDPSDVRKEFSKLIEQAKLPKIRIHDCRHSHATVLILEKKEDIKTVSERLGHQNIETTLNVYVSVLPTNQKALVEKLNEIENDFEGYEDFDG